MNPIREHDVVRVVSLEGMTCGRDPYYARQPEVGDIVTVLMPLRAPGHPDGYLCECVAEDGSSLWLATFPRAALSTMEADA